MNLLVCRQHRYTRALLTTAFDVVAEISPEAA